MYDVAANVIEFTIPAVPVAQPRAKATSFGGQTRVYNPTSIKQADGSKKPHPIVAFKATVRMVAADNYDGPPLAGPLRVDITAVFPRHSNKFWKTKPTPRYRHVTKPDRDNLDKAVLDALTGTLWADDKQVCAGMIEKWHASGTEQPHVIVRIERLETAGAV